MKCITIGIALAVLFISACSSIPPVQSLHLDKATIVQQKNNVKMGIVSTEVSAASLNLPGADCLLCIAVARAAHSDLSSHIKTLSGDVHQFDNLLLAQLQKQGFNAQIIDEKFDLDSVEKISTEKTQLYAARRDFTTIAKNYDLSHIIVFDFQSHGVVRDYSSYVATSPPYASVKGNVYMIDLASNQYVLNLNIDQRLSVQGQWKSPPTYPELTNAYYGVVETVKEYILEAFNLEAVK